MIGHRVLVPVLSAIVLVGSGFVPAAEADPILDAAFVSPMPYLSVGFGADATLAQTFTVGVTGVLTRVDVAIGFSNIASTAGDVVLGLRPTAGGVPVAYDAAALLELTIPEVRVPEPISFISVDLTPFRIAVTSGDILALTLGAPGTSALRYAWQAGTGNYERGAGFFRRGTSPEWARTFFDYDFRTFVEPPSPVPEPATILFVGSGIGLIAGVRQSRRSRSRS